MKLKALLAIFIFNFETFLFAAEAGMPQLDPKYWFSQTFLVDINFFNFIFSIIKIFYT